MPLKETEDSSMKVITEAVYSVFSPWIERSLEIPKTTVKELARITGILPLEVLRTVLTGRIMVNGYYPTSRAVICDVDFSDCRKNIERERKVTTASGISQTFARKLAAVRQDGQRWQRSPQFPARNEGKTTRSRALAKTRESQILNAKIGFVLAENNQIKTDITEANRRKQLKNSAKWVQKAECGEKRYLKSERDEADRKGAKFKSFVQGAASVKAAERPSRIREIVREAALDNTKPLIVANWVCPAGTALQLDTTSGQLYRRYVGADLEQGYLNDYRLVPRLNLERRLIRELDALQIPYRYLKIVADDNPKCLYQPGLKLDGEEDTYQTIQDFADFIQTKLNQELGEKKVEVVRFSQLLGLQLWTEFFKVFNSTTLNELLPFLPTDTLDIEYDVLTKHTNIDPELLKYIPQLRAAVVRQYGVEGYFLGKLFGDNVVLAWNESTKRSKVIDSLRALKGVPPLPKMFVLYEKKGGKIKNDY